eukprot:g5137.t1
MPERDYDETALLSTVRAKCLQGTRRANHGLRLEVEVLAGHSRQHAAAAAAVSSLRNVALDVCGDVYGALPPGAESIASFALPVGLAPHGRMLLLNEDRSAARRARGDAQRTSNPNEGGGGGSNGGCVMHIEVAPNVSRPTALRCLRSLAQQGGDPPFLIDILADANAVVAPGGGAAGAGPRPRGRRQLVARIPTKASCLLRSFSSSSEPGPGAAAQATRQATQHATQRAQRAQRAHDQDMCVCLPADAVPAPLLRAAARRRAPSPLRRAAALARWWLLPGLFVLFAACLASAHLGLAVPSGGNGGTGGGGTGGGDTGGGGVGSGGGRPALLTAVGHGKVTPPPRPAPAPAIAAGEARAVPAWIRSELPRWARVVRFDSERALQTIDAALPPLPRTRSAAFRLGAVCARHAAALAAGTAATARRLEEEAHALLARDAAGGAGAGAGAGGALPAVGAVRAGDMGAMLARLQEEEAHRGVVSHVLALFTLVNMVWLASILGVAVSLGPSLFVVLRPVYEALRAVARALLRRVLVPVARRLHRWCVFEVAAWLLAAGVVLDGHRYYAGSSGMHIAATGLAAGALALAYSTALHGGGVVRAEPRRAKDWCVAWAGLAAAPLAVVHDSALLGTVTVYAGYYLLGFSAFCAGCCWCFGFDSQNALERSAVASATIVAAVVAARGAASSRPWLARVLSPFRAPCSLCGAFVLMLALLILTLMARFEPSTRQRRRTTRPARHGARGARGAAAREPP